MPEDGRPDPDALLAALHPQSGTRPEIARGRLKIFLGAAPGVGKTYEMLNQARRRAKDGAGVLAGVIETHRRAETEAQVEGIEVLPRTAIDYRGNVLEEFDLEGALARHPELLLVDELAHTNAPGSRHAKRWEDVVELLDAGISVWTTLNVQHLESLNDDVLRITGIRPSETLPDRVLERADEIELVDLPPAELRQRLEDGKIYRADNARRALNGFFREGNLAALREIALRRAAAHVDEDVQQWMRRSGIAGPWPAGDRVVALIGPDASGEAVVRTAKRLASAMHAPWVALHVERPGHSAGGLGLRGPIALASQLGAELDLRASSGPDLVGTLIEAARARNATHLVVGRARSSRWRRLAGRTLGNELLRRAPDFVLHVVPLPAGARIKARPTRGEREGWLGWTAAVGLIAAVSAIGVAFRSLLPTQPADMVYLAAIVAVATLWGPRPAMLAAVLGVLAWDFFFIDPLYTVTMSSPRDLVTAVVFAGVAALTGSLAGRVRAEMRAAAARIEGLRRIGAFSRKLGEPATEAELMAEVARQAAGLAPAGGVVLAGEETLAVRAAEPAGLSLDEGAMAAASWAFARGEQAGRGTTTLPSAGWRFLPLQTVRGRLGVLGVRPGEVMDEALLQALEALADQATIALERVRLAGEAARTDAMEETHRLRAALLASLGHDLRTPLAGIQGSAGTLRAAWGQLEEAVRDDLLASIEEDVGRMARFLGNITDLTRLEGGELRPALVAIGVAELVEAAVSRMPNALTIAVAVPSDLVVRADPGLLEQALFNVLDNARKYAPDGALTRVSARRVRAMVEIEVADQGSGIARDDLPHVFDSFFRARLTDRTAPGVGLGLAIARGFVDAMDGSIRAASPNPTSSRGGLPGTVVTIAVPAGGAGS